MSQSKQFSQASDASNTSSRSASHAPETGGSLADQATNWLSKSSMSGLLGGLNKLSTTQKVVGGALVALGVGYLLRSGGSASAGSRSVAAPEGSTKESVDTLHELLHFVNDRIEGYERAVKESQDPERQGYYKQLVSQSQQFANELNAHLRQQGEDRETSTTVKGKLYRGWMDTKAALTGSDEKSILGSNIYGEEWALKAYEDALADQSLTGALRLEVERQYTQSQKAYKKLQKMQDQQ
ncbi:ferritin-like domain-containing protein [Hymenobacter jejuensis]|uniref:PA2169 family four-helix-bundle protein n=1 Tax=Hymenobacter jejuensis TaxID=2502781 RepID=A0A5B8A4Q7_9BACT|nr:PA2169 family four-helix-bundle protein [Hymenobacter jejuensis]QDA61623.1 PA2169 family four-helix-bundle protein [Hymenobacter jejuensis]